jgi:hypothetical protein
MAKHIPLHETGDIHRNLREAILATECATCDHTGFVRNPVWEKWFNEEAARERTKEGNSIAKPFEPVTIECEACEGTGYVLSGHGKAFVRIMSKIFVRKEKV